MTFYNCYFDAPNNTHWYERSRVALAGQVSDDNRRYFYASFTREIDARRYCAAEDARLKEGR